MAALLGCPSGRSTMRLILFLRSPPWRPDGYLREARAAHVASPVAPRRSPVTPVAKRESRWSYFSGGDERRHRAWQGPQGRGL